MSTLRATIIAFVVGALAGAGVACWLVSRRAASTSVGATSVVDRSELRPRDVAPHVIDQPGATSLVAAQAATGTKTLVLAETIGEIRSHSAGPATGNVTFGDWRLSFEAADGQASYTLRQRIEALAAIGKTPDGAFVADVTLFEVGPAGERWPLADPVTTVVAASPASERWRVSAALQAGIGASLLLPRVDVAAFGLAGVQWLKRGVSTAAEDCSLAILTPAIVADDGGVAPAILPVSLNLGRLPRQPFRDLWLSPMVAASRSGVRAGFVVTATF